MLSVIIPANNEADYIGACLTALISSDFEASPEAIDPEREIIVSANGCTDATVSVAEGYRAQAKARGWRLTVLDLKLPGKLKALNAGERAARGDVLIYIDADVVVSPRLVPQLLDALNQPDPAYASGRVVIAPSRTLISRAYGRIWARVPFMTDCVPGCGVFALNSAGRRRWGDYPQIISDDTFTRLQFSPHERIGVPASYTWPIAEGFRRLVRVRRRQDVGVAEVARLYPALMRNEDKPRIGAGRLLRLILSDPFGFCVYGAVALAVRLHRRSSHAWNRGR